MREIFEGTVGVANAAYRIPASIISGAIVGGYQGSRKGLDKDYQVTSRGSALNNLGVGAAQSQLQAGLIGFLVAGPPGAIASMALDGLNVGPGIYVALKCGSADEVGGRLASALNQSVQPGEGFLGGLTKGIGAGVFSSVQAAAVTGFREGKGMAAGLIEGVSAVPSEVANLKRPKGSWLQSTLLSGAGLVHSILSGPTGAVLPIVAGQCQDPKPPHLLKRILVSATAGAATGAAIGSLAGPIGVGIGMGAGALLNLTGPATTQDFAANVLDSVNRHEKGNQDLGSGIANSTRSLFESVFVGLASGLTNGWNATVAAPEKLNPSGPPAGDSDKPSS